MRILLSVFMLITFLTSTSQEESSGSFRLKNQKYYKVKVNNEPVQYLAGLTDSSINISKSKTPFVLNNTAIPVPFGSIEKLTLNREGNGGRGLLIGAFAGAVVGGIIGAATYKESDFLDFGRGFSVGVGAVIGTLFTGGIGALVGSAKHRYQVNRTRESFLSFYKEMVQ